MEATTYFGRRFAERYTVWSQMRVINFVMKMRTFLLVLLVVTAVFYCSEQAHSDQGRDMSSIIIYPDPSPDLGFLLEDAENRRSGWDPVKGVRLRKIPGSNVLNESVEDPQPWYVLYLKKPDSGQYKLEITGQRDFPFSLEIEFKGSRGKMLTRTIDGFMNAGKNYYYLLSFDKTNVESSAILPSTYQSSLLPRGTGTAASTNGQLTDQNQPVFTETYSNDQFKISFDYPEGCSLTEKAGSAKNTVVITVSCPMNDDGEEAFVTLVSDKFMPEREFQWVMEYLLGSPFSADGVSGSTYVTPFDFKEATNSGGVPGYLVSFSVVEEVYTDDGTTRSTTPRRVVAYDLGPGKGSGLRSVHFSTRSDRLWQIADSFRILE
jgi:hypothetical protein